jgi:hypothetical protein
MGLVPGNAEAGKGLRCGEHKLTERQEDGRRAVGRCSVGATEESSQWR